MIYAPGAMPVNLTLHWLAYVIFRRENKNNESPTIRMYFTSIFDKFWKDKCRIIGCNTITAEMFIKLICSNSKICIPSMKTRNELQTEASSRRISQNLSFVPEVKHKEKLWITHSHVLQCHLVLKNKIPKLMSLILLTPKLTSDLLCST